MLDKEQLAISLARMYYILTDEYDDQVLSGKTVRGESVASSSLEMFKSNHFANKVRTHIQQVALKHGISVSEFTNARRVVMRKYKY